MKCWYYKSRLDFVFLESLLLWSDFFMFDFTILGLVLIFLAVLKSRPSLVYCHILMQAEKNSQVVLDVNFDFTGVEEDTLSCQCWL